MSLCGEKACMEILGEVYNNFFPDMVSEIAIIPVLILIGIIVVYDWRRNDKGVRR